MVRMTTNFFHLQWGFAGSESGVRDQANKSAGESDLITGLSSASNVDAKKIRHDSAVPRETVDLLDQSEFRNRGM